MTGFNYMSFKRLTPSPIDMTACMNGMYGMNGMNGMRGMRGMNSLN